MHNNDDDVIKNMKILYFKFFKIYLLVSIIFLGCVKANSSEDINDIKNLLEGRYELVYWTENNIQYYYPEVAGTFILNNNYATITMDKNMDTNKSVELIGWGKYEITSKSFNIEWHDWKLLLIENNIKTVKKKSPWEGMREYSVYLEDNKLVFSFITGKQSWNINKNSIVYRDKEWSEDKDEVVRY